MATQVDVRCSCARDDVEASANGRCFRCGKLLRESFATQATPDRNNGAVPRSPSQAYRSPVEPFEATRSVAATTAARAHVPEPAAIPEQGAGSEAVPPTPQPSPQPLAGESVAPAPALGRPTREWIEQTRALGEELLTAADEEDRQADAARAKAATHATEAVRLRKSAAIFTQLLRAVDVPIASDPAPAGPGQPALPQPSGGLRWSRTSAVQVDACIDCGRADVPHCARGALPALRHQVARCGTAEGRAVMSWGQLRLDVGDAPGRKRRAQPAACPWCGHACMSHYAGVAIEPSDAVYRCHWVDGVPSGRCGCTQPIPGWSIYGERAS